MTTVSTRTILVLDIAMQPLTSRQTLLLKSLIDEYLSTAEPVGSLVLEKKYNLGVSPATLRNEMVTLTNMGYLKQPHTSAGRVPTPVAMKFYISQLMDEKAMSLTDEVRAKENIRVAQTNVDRLMNEVTHMLAENTGALAVASTEEGSIWSHGFSHVFESPEFFDHHVCQSVFSMIEEVNGLHELFFHKLTGLTPIEVLFGEELGYAFFEPVGIVASRFQANGREYALGVIGPFRLNYARVIPTVRYYGELMQQTLTNG